MTLPLHFRRLESLVLGIAVHPINHRHPSPADALFLILEQSHIRGKPQTPPLACHWWVLCN